jgi:hypothetical protein
MFADEWRQFWFSRIFGVRGNFFFFDFQVCKKMVPVTLYCIRNDGPREGGALMGTRINYSFNSWG